MSPSARRGLVAVAIGNFVELFDLTVFGFFAAVIGSQFFPSHASGVSLLSAFATFGVGFLMRPLGALLLGRIGDRAGRKQLLVLTMTLMMVASVGMAVVPGFASIGIAAPVLLVTFRLLQGLAAGGEWGGAVTMIIESAPDGKRGFIGSFQQLGFAIGTLAGTACSFALTSVLTNEQLAEWGWRIPFAIGALLAPIALFIRRRVEETPDFTDAKAAGRTVRTPVRVALGGHWRGILAVIGIGVLGTAAGYLGNQFMTSFASGTVGLAASAVSGTIMLAAAVQCVLTPVWGALADRVRPILIIGAAAIAYGVLILPLFALLDGTRSEWALTLLLIINAVLVSASFGPLPLAISMLFPTEVRTTAISIGYNIAVAVFGGFAPYAATALVGATGSPLSPTIYGVGCAVLTTITAITMGIRRFGGAREAALS